MSPAAPILPSNFRDVTAVRSHIVSSISQARSSKSSSSRTSSGNRQSSNESNRSRSSSGVNDGKGGSNAAGTAEIGWRQYIGTMAAVVLLAVGLVSFPVGQARALTEENLVFLEAWRVVDRAYVDKSFNGQSWFRYREQALKKEPMNNREQTYAAIRKMLASLDDPFTRFFEPGKFRSLKAGTQGELTGVGLELGFSPDGRQLVVVAPVPGGPADRAGVAPKDVILRVDGAAVEGLGLYDAAQRLQGPADSQVQLTVQRGEIKPAVQQRGRQQQQQSQQEQQQELTFTLTRQKVSLNPVIFRTCDLSRQASAVLLTSGAGSAGSFGSNTSLVTRTADSATGGLALAGGEEKVRVGYIRLTTFNQNSSSALKHALQQLSDEGATAFILDIRNNSGGLFPSAIEIAKMWLNKGVLVYITDSLGVRDVYETNGEGAVATSQPLAVLVNKGTASASEILAGALKDNNRALVFGEPTFGKGKIQSVFELSDGSGLAVTIARYETPDHTDIDKVGILPDYPLPEAIPMDPDQFCQCLCSGSPSNAAISSTSSNGAISSNGAANGAATFEYKDAAAAPACSLPSSLLFPQSSLAK
ncbi:hypothetical protein CLOM_g1517 [Closterium sp. NIES-68]|nr:hypothetical protein CLOM_g1517 [Closterium sp. NIES-68]GJP60775.1 hypothetical protein CLOP_g18000 [Closterium sp. NIES-67]